MKSISIGLTVLLIFLLIGCATVDYISYNENLKLTPKPKNAEIQIIEGSVPSAYEIIGELSITQSMPYGQWLVGPSREKAKEVLTKSNVEEIKKKARRIGADACCEIQHIESEGSTERKYPPSPLAESDDMIVSIEVTERTPVLYLSTKAKALIKK